MAYGVGSTLGGASSLAVKGWPEFHTWWPPRRSTRQGRVGKVGTSCTGEGGGDVMHRRGRKGHQAEVAVEEMRA